MWFFDYWWLWFGLASAMIIASYLGLRWNENACLRRVFDGGDANDARSDFYRRLFLAIGYVGIAMFAVTLISIVGLCLVSMGPFLDMFAKTVTKGFMPFSSW